MRYLTVSTGLWPLRPAGQRWRNLMRYLTVSTGLWPLRPAGTPTAPRDSSDLHRARTIVTGRGAYPAAVALRTAVRLTGPLTADRPADRPADG